MRKSAAAVALGLVAVLSAGCFGPGSGPGAVAGGIAGSLLDRENPWRGGIVGATAGAVFGATVNELSRRAAEEAAESGRRVEYWTENGRGRYEAEPMEDEGHGCRRIRERVLEDGTVVRRRIVNLCRGHERRWQREERDED